MNRLNVFKRIVIVGILGLMTFGCTSPIKIEPYYENPYQNYQYWYKGNTHTHTNASDGDYPLPEVLTKYDQAGYDFLVITDHNQTDIVGGGSGHSVNEPTIKLQGLAPNVDILWIRDSCESGDSWEHHLTAIGVTNCPEECGSHFGSGGLPYCDGGENQKRINQALEQNGLVFLNHPESVNWAGVEDGWPKEEALQMKDFHGVEISARDVPTWRYLLNNERMVWGVASDDFHEGEPGNGGWIVVNSNSIINDIQNYEASSQDIITNIRNGNFYSVVRGKNGSKDGPKFTKILSLGAAVSIEFTGASSVGFFDCYGLLKIDEFSGEGNSHSVSYIPDDDLGIRMPQGYLLIELFDHTGNLAYSQPLHVIRASACPSTPESIPPSCSTISEPCCTGYHSCGGRCFPNDMDCP